MSGLRSLFSHSIEVAGRLQRFINDLERGLGAGGDFAMGQPLRSPYTFEDPKTGEVVNLWRTVEDEERQQRYLLYREMVHRGFGVAMRRAKPELYAARTKAKRPELVREFDLLTVITETYTGLVNGEGVDLDTGIPELDDMLKAMELDTKITQWSWEASIFEFLGIECVFDHDTQAIDVRRCWPDHLFRVYDEDNADEVAHIAKRFWVPLRAVKDWNPVTMTTRSQSGIEQLLADQIETRGAQYTRQETDPMMVKQDGFVFEERHYRGWIEYAFYATAGNRILMEVPLELYDPAVAEQPVFFTGMPDFAITLFENVGANGRATSDWDRLLDGVIDFNTRMTKNGKLVDRYSEPKALVPASHIQVDPVTGKAQWGMGDSEAIVVRPTDQMKPEFLQPNPNYDAPQADQESVLEMIGLLSQARYAVDPKVAERIESAVALKLKMTPTLVKVAPRRKAQESAIRRLLYNIISAVEFHTSRPLGSMFPGDAREAELGLMFSGAVAAQVKVVAAKKEKATVSGRRISFGKLAGVFAGVRTADFVDPNEAERDDEERAAREFFLRPKTPQEVEVDEGGQAVLEETEFGDNVMPSKAAPAGISSSEIQKSADAAAVVDNVIALDMIKVRFRQALPQDEAEARQEVDSQLMSRRRYLTEVKGLTPEEADEEEKRILDEGERSMESNAFGLEDPMGGGGAPDGHLPNPDAQADAMALEAADLRARAAAAAPGANNPQNPGIGSSLQATAADGV